MSDKVQSPGIYVPAPTYPVSYTGTIDPGGWAAGPGKQAVIPRIHRREGDLEHNLIVEYLLTLQTTFLLGQELFIYDSISSTPGCYISTHNYTQQFRFTFDNDLRMACTSYATTYYVIAHYRKPSR